MATSQLTLFDLETLPGMACHKPTKKHPNGRTGTKAGYSAHKAIKESACAECDMANQEYKRQWAEKNAERISEQKRQYRADHKENIAEYLKQWRAENQKVIIEYRKQYRDENRELLAEKDKQYYAENRDRIIEHNRQYYAENRDAMLEYRNQYREKNRDDINEYNKRYYIENRDEVLERNKAYRIANPEKILTLGREATNRRRSRKRSLPADGYTLNDVTKTHGTVCYLCNTEVDLTLPHGNPLSPEIDHVHPISSPECPGDVLENAKWTHAACNRHKGAKLVSELTLPFPPPHATATDLPGTPVQAQ